MSKYLYIDGGDAGADYAAVVFDQEFPKDKWLELWNKSKEAGKSLTYDENDVYFGYEAMDLDEDSVLEIQNNMDYDHSKFADYFLVESTDVIPPLHKLVYEKVREVKDPKFSLGNAGIDLFIPEEIVYEWFSNNNSYNGSEGITDDIITLKPGDSIKIAAGIKFDIPEGYALDFLNKSGVALKGLTIGSELIDSSYTGEVNFHLVAHRPFTIEPGLKIVQAIIIKDYVPEFLIEEGIVNKETDRGSGGFGSTGSK